MEIIDIVIRGGLGVLSFVVLRFVILLIGKIKDSKEVEGVLKRYEDDYKKCAEKIDISISNIIDNCKNHSEKIIRLEEKLNAMKDTCEHNHQWNGIDRRRKDV